MKSTNIPPSVPKPPKNTGLHRRFLIALLIGFFLFLVVNLWLLHHTAPHHAKAMQAATVINNEVALQQIHRLQAADGAVAPENSSVIDNRSHYSIAPSQDADNNNNGHRFVIKTSDASCR